MAGTVANLLYGVPEYVKIGTYGTAEGACTDIGFTDAGFKITPSVSYEKRTVDQVAGAVKANLKEVSFQLQVIFAEVDLDNLRIGLGLPPGNLAAGVLSIGSGFGVPGDEPNYLTLFAQGPGPSGGTRHMHVKKIYAIGDVVEGMENSKKTYTVTFELIYDTTATAAEAWMKITDTSGDAVAPTVSSTTPADTTINVAVDVSPTITFAEAINGSFVNGVYFKIVKASDGTAVAISSYTLNAAKTIVTLDPTVNLGNSTAYIIIVSNGIQDLAGNELAADYYVNFTTIA